MTDSGRYAIQLISPDVSDALVGDGRMNNRVRDRAMAREGLKRSRIDSQRSRQHVSMDRGMAC